MLDIDKELKALSKIQHKPSDTLRASTHALVQKEAQYLQGGKPKASVKPVLTLRWASVCTVAAALILIAVLVFSPAHTAQAAGYYTVDINPSVTLSVDADDIVLSAAAGNDDADILLEGMELAGLPIGDALDTLVRAAAKGGWLEDSGHVLVAHFGDTPGISEQQAVDIVSSAAGNTVNVLFLQSTKEDYEAAEKQHKSAGLELLRRNAQSLGIDGNMDMNDVITAIENKNPPQTNGGQSSNHKPDTVHTTEKPSPTPKPTATAVPKNSSEQQGNGHDNAEKPDKPSDNGKPDKDKKSDSGSNGHDGGKDNDNGKNNGKGEGSQDNGSKSSR